MDYLCKSESETKKLAAKIARTAKGGEIFALFGDLGSGKTTFAQGFAAALGVSKQVTSPTFVVLKDYPVQSDRIKHLVHVDCYRLETSMDAESIGLSEYLDDPTAIMLIEWPERIWPSLKSRAKIIKFQMSDENSRRITI